MLKQHRWRLAGIAVALLVIVAGKQFYRTASADDLRWILAPTAQLVSWTTGGDFVYEAGPGWVDASIGFIIAPPCAGVNFALAAFLALALGSASAMTSLRSTVSRLALAAGLAYLATLVVNTLRITIAVAMHRGDIDLGGIDRAEAHHVEGIVVYLCGLLVLYAAARGIERKKPTWLAIPIAAYLVITLVLPIANGALTRPDFLAHAALIVGACVVAVGAVLATHALVATRRTP